MSQDAETVAPRLRPPEVVLDVHGRQDLPPGFSRYEYCAGNCGWLIGCGDAVGEVWHESCELRVNGPRTDRYQRVQDFIDSCSKVERQVAILRLMRMDNDGERHFDHGNEHDPALGYSWACLACQQMGRGALNGWAGALEMLSTMHHNDGSGG